MVSSDISESGSESNIGCASRNSDKRFIFNVDASEMFTPPSTCAAVNVADFKSAPTRMTMRVASMAYSITSNSHSNVNCVLCEPSSFITHKLATPVLSLMKNIFPLILAVVCGDHAPRIDHDSGVNSFASAQAVPFAPTASAPHHLQILACSPPSYRFVEDDCLKG